MSADGAHLGVSADRALDTILGGAPQPERQRTPTELRAELEACRGPSDYDGTARWAAKLVLAEFDADPSLLELPLETQYDWPAIHAVDGWDIDTMREHVTQRSLYDVLKDRGVPLAELGLTGFMWGWAANAARYCVDAPPAPNPAILTIGGTE